MTGASVLSNLDQQDADALSGAEELDNLDLQDAEALQAGKPLTVTGKDLQKYLKVAKTVYGMFGGEDEALRGAPQRPQRPDDADEDWQPSPEQEAEYGRQVVEYLGLDPATIAEAGFDPGSPEYLEYVLSQADSIIRQVLGDLDPETEDFVGRLRTKSGKELEQLKRALYVRGQLGVLVGPGRYTDPFTGIDEDVAAQPGKRFQPSIAAWQRGLARSAEELAGKSAQEGKRFLGGMFDRNPDLFRMQSQRDARRLQEILAQLSPEDDLKRKRRGMFGEEAYFQNELAGMDPRELEGLLRMLMGDDEERQGAAMEDLFGWSM